MTETSSNKNTHLTSIHSNCCQVVGVLLVPGQTEQGCVRGVLIDDCRMLKVPEVKHSDWSICTWDRKWVCLLIFLVWSLSLLHLGNISDCLNNHYHHYHTFCKNYGSVHKVTFITISIIYNLNCLKPKLDCIKKLFNKLHRPLLCLRIKLNPITQGQITGKKD